MPSIHWITIAACLLAGCPGDQSPPLEIESGRYWAHTTRSGTADSAVITWFEYKPASIDWGFTPKTADRSLATGDAFGGVYLYGLEPGTTYDIRMCLREATTTGFCDDPTQFTTTAPTSLPWISVDPANSRQLITEAGARFTVWGNNYVRVTGADYNHGMVEDQMYDAAGLALIDADFARLENTAPPDGTQTAIRMHVQLHTFLTDATTPDPEALARFAHVIELAEDHDLHVMVTGLNDFYPPDNPAWLGTQSDEEQHWSTQSTWWTNMAIALHASSGVFAYDLMNEPYVGGNKIDPDGRVQWTNVPPDQYCSYGENAALGIHGTCFGQFVTADQGTRAAADVAAAWATRMVHAIRYAGYFDNDPRHLVTIGAAGAFGLSNPFNGSTAVHAQLDFLSPHLYPDNAMNDPIVLAQSLAALTTKPIIAGETFTFGNVRHLISTTCNANTVQGWFGQSDGRMLGDACNNPNPYACALYDAWYQVQAAYGPAMLAGSCPPAE